MIVINRDKLKKAVLGLCILTLLAIGFIQGAPRFVYLKQTPCLILSTRNFPYKLYSKDSPTYASNRTMVLKNLKYATHFTTVPFSNKKKLKYKEQMYCITFAQALNVTTLNGKTIVFDQLILPKPKVGHYILCANTQEKEYYVIDSLSTDVLKNN